MPIAEQSAEALSGLDDARLGGGRAAPREEHGRIGSASCRQPGRDECRERDGQFGQVIVAARGIDLGNQVAGGDSIDQFLIRHILDGFGLVFWLGTISLFQNGPAAIFF